MSERYEREIDELLRRIDIHRKESVFNRTARRMGPFWQGAQGAFAAFLRRQPSEQLMIASLVLALISFLLSQFGVALWAGFTGILSLMLFVLGIGVSLLGRHSPGYRKRWRGRELDYNTYGSSIWTQLRVWWQHRRRRFR
jgi:hypothetical protein